MAVQVVGISELLVSKRPEDILITYSLGSCIGVAAFDPEVGVGGMIHYMLPSSKVSPEKATAAPAMFGDTGLPLLFEKMIDLGASKSRLIVKVAGGAQLMDPRKVFNIGERNFLVLRKILWNNRILIKAQDVGGAVSRTLRLEVGTGRVTLKTSAGEQDL